MKSNLHWKCCSFKQLSSEELYEILSIRQKVFIVEQACAYLDTDEKDLKALHLYASNGNNIIAYARLLPPGISYTQASIGRVLVLPEYRGHKTGRLLMNKAIEIIYETYRTDSICISAQLYLKEFYRSLGFEPIGSVYDEDGIPHIKMVHQLS
jgi:ElaA protein